MDGGVLSIGLMLTGAAVALVAIGWFAGRVADEAVAVAAIVAGVALVGLAWLPRPAASPEAPEVPLVLSPAPGNPPAGPPPPLPGREAVRIEIEATEAEPNDTLPGANLARLGVSVDGALGTGDRDWFAIDVAPGTRGRLVASLVTEEASVTMTLVDDAGQVLGIARTIDEVRVRAATLERDLDRPRYHVLLMPGSDVPARYQLTLAARRW
jgi:hypothetical protein